MVVAVDCSLNLTHSGRGHTASIAAGSAGRVLCRSYQLATQAGDWCCLEPAIAHLSERILATFRDQHGAWQMAVFMLKETKDSTTQWFLSSVLEVRSLCVRALLMAARRQSCREVGAQ